MIEKHILPLNDKYEIKINYFIESKLHHIFNTPAFFKLHQTERSFYFQLSKKVTNEVVGTIHFTEVSPTLFKSPAKGTFGGAVTKENLDFDIYEDFFKAVDRYLWLNGAKRIEIILPPMCHNPSTFSINYNILSRQNYVVGNQELNYALIIDNQPFLSKINDPNRKRHLNKCLQDGFTTQQLDNSFYQQAHSLIVENGNRKGFTFSMSYEQVMQMVYTFPEKFLFFGVFNQNILVASSICVVVNPVILYVFAWGNLDNMQSYSPITLIADHIYEYAQKNNFKIMDIGISTYKGEPNLGLIQFKKKLGCQESLKLSFVKNFHS